MRAKPIDLQELKKVFRLNENGTIERYRVVHHGGGLLKKPYWREVKGSKRGNYLGVKWNGSMYPYHSILWVLQHGEELSADLKIDHNDGNKMNNSLQNLKVVTNRENLQK